MTSNTSFRKDISVVSTPTEFKSAKRNNYFLEIVRGQYRLRLAASQDDRNAAFRLRFMVFNLELNEGLESAFENGLDTDAFDDFCSHLIVEHMPTGQVVGTYRLQTAAVARANRGFYSENEFDFAPYDAIVDQLIELGRACIHRDHRSSEVLNLLWQGVIRFSVDHGGRYLIGCCSLTSQDSAYGSAVYEVLQSYQVDPVLRTTPKPAFALPMTVVEGASKAIPKLLRTYLAIGAKICGPPAIDREFKTIDFLTFLDILSLHPNISTRLMRLD